MSKENFSSICDVIIQIVFYFYAKFPNVQHTLPYLNIYIFITHLGHQKRIFQRIDHFDSLLLLSVEILCDLLC